MRLHTTIQIHWCSILKLTSFVFVEDLETGTAAISRPQICPSVDRGRAALLMTEEMQVLYILRTALSHLAAISVWRSCRLIYHEAVPILWSSNTFTLARTPDIHDYEGCFIGKAIPSLLSIGSQLPLLKKVVIDLATLCPYACDDHFPFLREGFASDYLHFGDLLRVLWNGACNFDVTFIDESQSGCCGYKSNCEEHCSRVPCSCVDTEALTETLRALRRDDLDIKRWLDHVCVIGVHVNGNDGFILFRSTHSRPSVESGRDGYRSTHYHPCFESDRGGYHPCLSSMLKFTVAHGLGLKIERPPPNLHNLPVRVQR
jgi:hypothetical protein